MKYVNPGTNKHVYHTVRECAHLTDCYRLATELDERYNWSQCEYCQDLEFERRL